jgi:hypothetical protein
MALLHESVDSKKLDVRMVERNIARGVIAQSDLDHSVKNLPDDAVNADWTSIASLSNLPEEAEVSVKSAPHQH